MLVVTETQKKIAKHVASALGGNQHKIFAHWDEFKENSIYLMRAEDLPVAGVTAYATIGVSDHPLYFNGEEYPARVEFVGACASNVIEFDVVMTTVAFCITKSKWFAAPGKIFPDAISMCGISRTLSDIYFANPFLWEDTLQAATIDERTVAWLLAVPISRAEREFAVRYGSDKLEELFVEHQIDVYDINRRSVV